MIAWDDGIIVQRTPVQIARDFLDGNRCVSMNPFISCRNRAELLDVLNEFSTQIRLAGEKLANVTGIPFKRERKEILAHDLVQIFIVSGLDRKTPEERLMEIFSRKVRDAYFSLRELEKDPDNQKQAQTTMKNLEKLDVVVTAAPIVYSATPVERQADFVFRA